jgi:hypothetical protein
MRCLIHRYNRKTHPFGQEIKLENLELDLKLTVSHVNTLLKHLGAGIYSEVAEVIQLLHGQAQPQIQAAAVAMPPVPNDVAQPAATEPAPETPAQ